MSDAKLDHGGLPVLRLTCQEFKSLLEYSATMPTGVYPGKRWRRLDGSHDQRFIRSGGQPRWLVGEYYAAPPRTSDGAEMCGTRWYRPVITVRAP